MSPIAEAMSSVPPPKLRPEPRICLYSIGWSEVPDNAESLLVFVFDISNVQGDADQKAARWDFFGGEGSALDSELSQIQILRDLDGFLRNMLFRCQERIEEADERGVDLPTIVITVCCAWGKHRSRFVVQKVGQWFQDQLEEKEHVFVASHLSERSRRAEVQHAQRLKCKGCNHGQAIASAKQIGSLYG